MAGHTRTHAHTPKGAQMLSSIASIILAQACLPVGSSCYAAPASVQNDAAFKIGLTADIGAKRTQLIQAIWNTTSLPGAAVTVSQSNSLFAALPNLQSIQRLDQAVSGRAAAPAYLYSPLRKLRSDDLRHTS